MGRRFATLVSIGPTPCSKNRCPEVGKNRCRESRYARSANYLIWFWLVFLDLVGLVFVLFGLSRFGLVWFGFGSNWFGWVNSFSFKDAPAPEVRTRMARVDFFFTDLGMPGRDPRSVKNQVKPNRITIIKPLMRVRFADQRGGDHPVGGPRGHPAHDGPLRYAQPWGYPQG